MKKNTKLKILIASDTYYPSANGAAYFTYRLATRLSHEGHSVFVITPSLNLHNTVFTQDGVVVYAIRSFPITINPPVRLAPLFLSRKYIKKIVQKINPDIIHIQNHFSIAEGVVEVARESSIPIIGTSHFMPENLVHYLHLPTFLEEKLKSFAWRQFCNIYSQLDFVTTPTKTAVRLVKNKGLQKRVIALSCGIDLERFNPRKDGTYIKNKYNLPDRPIILYVGRLAKEKRIEVIIHAIPLILQKINVQLVLAGVGKLRTYLEKLTHELNIVEHVTFTGFVPDKDLPFLYRTADIFVNASIAELQSIVTMEAMASGLPIIAANVMALPELAHNGKNGFLFPNGDSQTLARHAIKILTHEKLKTHMAQKSLELIKIHDIKKIIPRYESLYQKIIKRKHSPTITPLFHKNETSYT